jgi:hypothetical protein
LNTISSISWRPRRRRRLLIDDSLPLGQLPPLHRSEFEEGVTTVYHHGAKAEEGCNRVRFDPERRRKTGSDQVHQRPQGAEDQFDL